jgi:hypothetical protein
MKYPLSKIALHFVTAEVKAASVNFTLSALLCSYQFGSVQRTSEVTIPSRKIEEAQLWRLRLCGTVSFSRP